MHQEARRFFYIFFMLVFSMAAWGAVVVKEARRFFYIFFMLVLKASSFIPSRSSPSKES
jgi:hypothetical protein